MTRFGGADHARDWRVRCALAVLLALAVRLPLILLCDLPLGDVARYERMARHLLDVSWNPYQTRHLYPYPPPWAAVEAGAGWLARRGALPFPLAVKLPVLGADLLVVGVLAAAAARGRAATCAPWLYALHPVSVLIGAAHGQFDALALVFVLLALAALGRLRRDASALALSAAIATKTFPVLLLPLLATAHGASRRQALRYAVLALGPLALLLLPFAAADAGALGRELFAYSGVADFGWTGLVRGVRWLAGSPLPRSEARFWPLASLVSKTAFLLAWGLLLRALRSGRLRLSPERASLAVVLAFLTLYGLQSAQYLLWAVPLGLLSTSPTDRPRLAFHGAAASAALVGFYLFLAPGVLAPGALDPTAAAWAGRLFVLGVAATLAASGYWLVALLREGGYLQHGPP